MKKSIAQKKSPKKTEAKKKAVTQKSKPAAKNVLQLKKTKAPQKAARPQQQKPVAPAPKVHPFAAFMKDRWSARSFSGSTRKMGSQDVYRKKAV